MQLRQKKRERGSVLLLVLVAILILVLLGVSYLAMARIDRRAVAGLRDGNIDAVIAAIISQIETTLADDITSYKSGSGNTGPRLFRYDGASNDGTETGFDEPYDYPWTNTGSGSTFQVLSRLTGSSLGNAKGSHLDDIWLASILPEDLGSSAFWPHITNLNGVFLQIQTDNSAPVEHLVDHAGTTRTDTGVLISDLAAIPNSPSNEEPFGVDADGDGVPDSRWTWAPIDRIGDIVYIMAVRIVDSSARINPSASWYTGGGADIEAPRWWYPADLNLAAVLGLSPSASALENWFDYLGNGVVNFNAVSQAPQRDDLWFAGPRHGLPPTQSSGWGTTTVPGRDAAAEIEIYNRFGLNNSAYTSPLEDSSTGFASELRSATDETSYTVFSGGSDAARMANYFTNNPRLRLSHYTGSSQLATAQHGDPPVNNARMLRLSTLVTGDTVSRNAARKAMVSVLTDRDMPFQTSTSSTQPTAIPPTTVISRANLANQFVACFTDFYDKDSNDDGDDDSIITRVGTRYGMEALPFLTEVYLQGAYWLTSVTPAFNGPGPYTAHWTLKDNVGYIIEIVNPFSSQVQNLEDIRLRYQYTNDDNLPAGNNWRYPVGGTAPHVDNDNLRHLVGNQTLAANGEIYLWRNSGGVGGAANIFLQANVPDNSTDSGNDRLTRDMGNATAAGKGDLPAPVDLIVPTATYPDATRLYVELQVKAEIATSAVADSPAPTASQITGDATLNGTANFYTGMVLTFTSGARKGESRLITGYTTARRFTVSPAFTAAPSAGDTFAVYDWITYSRVMRPPSQSGDATEALALPQTITRDNVQIDLDPTTVADADQNAQRYIMRTAYCNPVGLNPLAARCTTANNDFHAEEGVDPDNVAHWPNPASTLVDSRQVLPAAIAGGQLPKTAQAGEATKSGASTEYLTGLDTLKYAFDDMEPVYPTDIFRVMWVAPYKHMPDETAALSDLTYAEAFHAMEQPASALPSTEYNDVLRARMINIYADNAFTTGTTNRNVPRGQLLLDRIIAVPVQNSTDPVIGRINLNTIPAAWLDLALPLANNTLRQSLVNKIVALRERSLTGTRPAALKGIASVGELMQLVDASPNSSNSIDGWARDGGFTATDGGLPVAFESDGSVKSSGIANDRAEEVRLAGMLANVAGVRSDFFAAFVVVRGYIAGDLMEEPAESAQFVVIFDRSNVSSIVDSPRIVAFKRIK